MDLFGFRSSPSPRVRDPAADFTARATVVLPLSYLSRFHQDDHQSDMRMTCRAMPCLNQKLKVVVMEANSEGCCAGPARPCVRWLHALCVRAWACIWKHMVPSLFF